MFGQERDEGDFADGLRAWVRGDDTTEAEAAGALLAETILMWRAVLKTKVKRGI